MVKRKILLADDSVTIQKVVNLTFADEGFDVIAVGDGNSAVDKLREESPDIVLADVNMPGLNGYEICEKIKHDDGFNSVPVILLVGSFEPYDEEEAARVGADRRLTKPFQSINKLVESVSLLISDSPATQNMVPTQEIPLDDHGDDDQMISADVYDKFPEIVDDETAVDIDPHAENSSDSAESGDFGVAEQDEVVEAEMATLPDDGPMNRDYLEADSQFAESEPVAEEVENTVENEVVSVDANDGFRIIGQESDISAVIDEPTSDEAVISNSGDEGFQIVTPEVDENVPAEIAEDEAVARDTSESYESDSVDHFDAPEEVVQFESTSQEPDLAEPTPETVEASGTENVPSPADSEFDLDDLNPLELAFIDPQKSEDIDAAGTSGDLDELDVSPDVEENPVAEEINEVSISPEMISKIVYKVIDSMSDEVIMQVARELVPTKVDSIIREIVEEKIKD